MVLLDVCEVAWGRVARSDAGGGEDERGGADRDERAHDGDEQRAWAPRRVGGVRGALECGHGLLLCGEPRRAALGWIVCRARFGHCAGRRLRRAYIRVKPGLRRL